MNIGKIVIEKSPTGKCTCTTCGSILELGSVRVVQTIGSGKWAKTKRYCAKDGKQVITDLATQLSIYGENL